MLREYPETSPCPHGGSGLIARRGEKEKCALASLWRDYNPMYVEQHLERFNCPAPHSCPYRSGLWIEVE